MPQTETVKLDPNNNCSATDADIDRLHDIEDSFTTLSSVNPDRYPQEYKMLLAYPKGFAMKVSYFHRNSSDIDIRSFATDISIYADDIHVDFTKVVGLEMKLEEPLSYNTQEQDNTVQLTGVGIMYPGFEPYEGDIFLLEADNRNVYLFHIDSITPTTYRQERYYRVTFNAYNIVNEELYHKLNSWVTEVCYFDKRKYFGESEYTFLSKDSYNQLTTLRGLRKAITQEFVNTYFSETDDTFLRPDGVYDPYCVEYLRKKLSVADYSVRPKQIFTRLKNYYKSIWFKFVDAENVDISDLTPTFKILKHIPYMYDSDLNSLSLKYYISLEEMTQEDINYYKAHANELYTSDDRYASKVTPLHYHCSVDCCLCHSGGSDTTTDDEDALLHAPYYIFSDAFYKGYQGDMSELEVMIYKYFNDSDNLNIPYFVDILSKYRKIKPSVTGFYTWALYLEFVDMCILKIK